MLNVQIALGLKFFSKISDVSKDQFFGGKDIMIDNKDLTEQILKGLIEAHEREEETEDIFSDPFDDDIISIWNDMGEDFMEDNTIELITVISLKDNPTLNLSVAQPSKYKISKTSLGTGIMCYQINALDILRKHIKRDEQIIKVTVDKNVKILNLCLYRDKQYLKDIYESISDKSIIKTDADFIDYVCNKGKKKYKGVMGFITLGKTIYTDSLIPDYMDKGFILMDEKIIKKAEAVI